MSTLKHPVTGHEVHTDDESVGFWEAAGYTAADPKPKKAPAKKAAAKKSSKK